MEDESEEDNDCCIICNTQLSVSETVTVTAKGIETLIDSSLKRKDGLHSKFETLPTIILHKECCKKYTCNTSMRAYIAPSLIKIWNKAVVFYLQKVGPTL